MKIINFDDAEDIEQAERYLLATALSTHPSEPTLKHLLVRAALSALSLFFFFFFFSDNAHSSELSNVVHGRLKHA